MQMPLRTLRSVAVRLAVLCLILTVISLGAAAKHNQFDNPSQGTSYLTQSVKMVAGDEMPALITLPMTCFALGIGLPLTVPTLALSPAPVLALIAGPLLV